MARGGGGALRLWLDGRRRSGSGPGGAGPGRTGRHSAAPDVGRGASRRGHTPSPDLAPTVPRLAEAAAVCGALSRSPVPCRRCECGGGGLGHSDPKVISLFTPSALGFGASRYPACLRGTCILVSCPGFAWPLLPPIPHPWHPTQYPWSWPPGALLTPVLCFSVVILHESQTRFSVLRAEASSLDLGGEKKSWL